MQGKVNGYKKRRIQRIDLMWKMVGCTIKSMKRGREQNGEKMLCMSVGVIADLVA